ncbi:MAG: hypothetical protein WD178_08060 [Actinomycetota bacterium]
MNKQRLARGVLVAAIGIGAIGGAAVASSDSGFTELPSVANKLIGRTSAAQREVLADKKVTRKEYERAVAETMTCLRAKGFTIEGPVASEANLLAYDFVVADLTPEMSDAINAAQDQCAGEFLDEVEQLYLQQLTPRGEKRKALQKELAECVKAATNKPATEASSPGELMEFIRNQGSNAAYDCRAKYDLLFTDPL